MPSYKPLALFLKSWFTRTGMLFWLAAVAYGSICDWQHRVRHLPKDYVPSYIELRKLEGEVVMVAEIFFVGLVLILSGAVRVLKKTDDRGIIKWL